MKWYLVKCTDILAFLSRLRKPQKTSTRRPSNEGCATSHDLKWDRLPSNKLGRIAQHVREKERRKGQSRRDKVKIPLKREQGRAEEDILCLWLKGLKKRWNRNWRRKAQGRMEWTEIIRQTWSSNDHDARKREREREREKERNSTSVIFLWKNSINRFTKMALSHFSSKLSLKHWKI